MTGELSSKNYAEILSNHGSMAGLAQIVPSGTVARFIHGPYPPPKRWARVV